MLNNRPALPAELQEEIAGMSNLVPVERVPSMGVTGKVFSVSIDGNVTQLMRKDADGESQPVPLIKVVILDYAKNRGRAYYEGAYVKDKPTMPSCWSDDGVVPSEHVVHKQATSCGKCPMSTKGSKVSEDGREMTACQQIRLVALKLWSKSADIQPLRLKLAITSDWDGKRDNKGGDPWYGFKNYVDYLKASEVDHTALLVTKIKFDPNEAYPKLLFSAGEWLTPEEVGKVIPIVKSVEVHDLISKNWTPNGTDGHRTDDAETTEDETPPPKPKPAPAKPEPDDEEAADEITVAVKPAAKAAPTQAAKPTNGKAPIAAKAPEKAAVGKGKAAPKDEKIPKPEAPEVDSAVADLMNEWG
jgi:hypothetical protein